jgi:putative oxidoreductase
MRERGNSADANPRALWLASPSQLETNMRDLALAIGRIALVAAFIWSGFGKLIDLQGAAAAIGGKALPIPLGGIGLIVAALVAGLVELVGGLMVVVGYRARLVALVLIVFTVAATALYHDFWAMTGPSRSLNLIMALKNLSMCGGLLFLAAVGPGRFSLDGRSGA